MPNFNRIIFSQSRGISLTMTGNESSVLFMLKLQNLSFPLRVNHFLKTPAVILGHKVGIVGRNGTGKHPCFA